MHMYERLTEMAEMVHTSNVLAGWWSPGDTTNVNVLGTKIALIHSEVSEMLEGLRKDLQDDHLPDRKMEEVEAADVFIRLLDYCGARGFDIGAAVLEKSRYNKQRADHKAAARSASGGKKF